MYVEIFKTVFDVTLTNNFQYQGQFLCMRVTNWPNIFMDQGQFSDPDYSKMFKICLFCFVDNKLFSGKKKNTITGPDCK